MNITRLELSEDYKTLNINFTKDGTYSSPRLFLHINDCFKKSCMDLTLKIVEVAPSHYRAVIPVCEIRDGTSVGDDGTCGFNQDIYDGIFAVEVSGMMGNKRVSTVKAFINTFYLSTCLAHYVLAVDDRTKFDESNMLYMMIEAAEAYVRNGQIELGIEAFTKAKAICESNGKEIYKTDIAACSQGTGCWITSGVYVKV